MTYENCGEECLEDVRYEIGSGFDSRCELVWTILRLCYERCCCACVDRIDTRGRIVNIKCKPIVNAEGGIL